jgi:hypothetical protein
MTDTLSHLRLSSNWTRFRRRTMTALNFMTDASRHPYRPPQTRDAPGASRNYEWLVLCYRGLVYSTRGPRCRAASSRIGREDHGPLVFGISFSARAPTNVPETVRRPDRGANPWAHDRRPLTGWDGAVRAPDQRNEERDACRLNESRNSTAANQVLSGHLLFRRAKLSS